jgi:PAS domain S-box-containing protein
MTHDQTRSHHESEAILQALKDDLLVTDKNGTIMSVSDATKKLYGIEDRDVLGTTVYQLEKEGVFTPIVSPLVIEQKGPRQRDSDDVFREKTADYRGARI